MLYRHFSVIKSQHKLKGEEDLCECVYSRWWRQRQMIYNMLLHVLLQAS